MEASAESSCWGWLAPGRRLRVAWLRLPGLPWSALTGRSRACRAYAIGTSGQGKSLALCFLCLSLLRLASSFPLHPRSFWPQKRFARPMVRHPFFLSARRLCAVMLDCLGRDMMVRREYGVDENGWPGIFQRLTINAGQTVRSQHREGHGC